MLKYLSLICWITHFGEYQRPLWLDIYMDIYRYIWIYIWRWYIYVQYICPKIYLSKFFAESWLSRHCTELKQIFKHRDRDSKYNSKLKYKLFADENSWRVSGHSEVLPFGHLPCSVRGHKVCNVLKWPSREMTYVISRQISKMWNALAFHNFWYFLGHFCGIKQPFAIFDMFDSFWQFLTDNDYGLEPSTLKKLPHFQTAPDVGFLMVSPI